MNEKEPMVNQNGELLTEPYDNNVKMESGEDVFALFAGQKQLPIDYQLTADEVKLGLLRFQRMTTFRKNWIYTVILGIIFVLYLVKIILNPMDGLGIFLTVMSLAVIAFIWALPAMHRNKMAKTISNSTDTYRLTVCETGLIAGVGQDASYIYFENEPIEAVVYPDMILFNICKEKIFILPNRCMGEQKRDEIIKLLQAGLNEERYIQKEK